MKKQITKKIETNKTYEERAIYLSFIKPDNTKIYRAIAEFFGNNEIPPKIKKTN